MMKSTMKCLGVTHQGIEDIAALEVSEILNQNSEWLPNVSYLTAKDETLRYDAKIVIAMVQTAFARIKKYGTAYLGDFDNIILDEVQVLIFEKVFEQYNYKKLIGFTGTPVLNKKKYRLNQKSGD